MRIKRKIFNLIMFSILILSLGLCGFLYYKLQKIDTTGETNSKQEIKSLVDKVSRLYLIPSNEEPTIATVSDPQILKDQSFFTLAEKGDKVLIFTRASKAVLYRPSIDKIIEIAPIKNNPLSSNSSQNNVETPQEKTN